MTTCRLIDLGRVEYAQALSLMRDLVEVRRDPAWPDLLLLAEHSPVVTLGRRGRAEDIKAAPEVLDQANLPVFKIERGGLATWHGPGQLVMYPIFRLRNLGLGVAEFVRQLEETVIRVLKDFGITAGRRLDHPGVWIGREKIASLGLAIRRNVTFHGLALNCSPDLTWFDFIHPCGLSENVITSVSKLLGRTVDPEAVKPVLVKHFSQVFGLEMVPWNLEDLTAALEQGNHLTSPPHTAPLPDWEKKRV